MFMANGGGLEIAATKRGKGMKIIAIVDRRGFQVAKTAAIETAPVRVRSGGRLAKC
jgi:hypothetical protein